jgi:hypothetical protein
MTRLPDGVARPAQRRIATSIYGDLVLVLNERNVTIKPKGARTNGIVTVTWGAIYERALLSEIEAARSAARRAKKKSARRRKP